MTDPYREEEIKVKVGRDDMSGLFATEWDARGDRGIIHRFKIRVARGPLGRFVKRRQPPDPPKPWDVR